jgi:uncharacterized protein YcgI (DUF1989 family)
MDSKKITSPIARYHLEPQTGKAFTVQKDQCIRVIDAEIELQAQMDLIVGVTACLAGQCNNFECTAVDIEVSAAREQN